MSREIGNTPSSRVITDAGNREEAAAHTRLVFAATQLALETKRTNAETLGPYGPRDSMSGDPASPSGTLVELSELADDVLAAIAAAAASGTARTPFREIDITSALVVQGDILNVQTGAFSGAGAQAVFSSYGTPVLPAAAAEFRDDTRIKLWFNGVLLSKGAALGDGRDVYPLSTVYVVFGFKLRQGDIIRVETLDAF